TAPQQQVHQRGQPGGGQRVLGAGRHYPTDVGHSAAATEPLGGGGDDGGVGDRGEVVTEDPAGNDRARQQRRLRPQRHTRRVEDRERGEHGADRGAGRHRDRTHHNEREEGEQPGIDPYFVGQP